MARSLLEGGESEMGLCPTDGVSVLLSKWSDLRPYACWIGVLAKPGCVRGVAPAGATCAFRETGPDRKRWSGNEVRRFDNVNQRSSQ
jgi:hypothetical protein